jgi:hypothetical protein
MMAIVSETLEETMIASLISKKMFDGAASLGKGEIVGESMIKSMPILSLAGVIRKLEATCFKANHTVQPGTTKGVGLAEDTLIDQIHDSSCSIVWASVFFFFYSSHVGISYCIRFDLDCTDTSTWLWFGVIVFMW